MTTLADLIKSRRESGQGVLKSLGKSLKDKIKEKIDPRQFINQAGILVALFPQLKTFKAKPINVKKPSEKITASPDITSPSLENISLNTQMLAKNTMVLPAIHRDMNVMRQNIVKLVKLEGEKPATKADAWFRKSKFRETEYETKISKTVPKAKVKKVSKVPTQPKTTFGKIGETLKTIGGSKAVQVAAGAAVGAAVGLSALTARGESKGGDYNIVVGGTSANLTSMTLGEVLQFQSQMKSSKKYPSTAVGKYQIIQSTLEGAIKTMGLDLNEKFDEKMQERIFKEYLIGSKRKNVSAYLNGTVPDTPENLQKAQMDMAMEFASYGVPRDVRAGEFGEWPKRNISKGESFYSGSAGNKASISPEDSAVALKQDRMRNEGKVVTPHPGTTPEGRPVPEPTPRNAGDKVNSTSTEVQRGKNAPPTTDVVIQKERVTQYVPVPQSSQTGKNSYDESRYLFERAVG